jgi:hypothetical protein
MQIANVWVHRNHGISFSFRAMPCAEATRKREWKLAGANLLARCRRFGKDGLSLPTGDRVSANRAVSSDKSAFRQLEIGAKAS